MRLKSKILMSIVATTLLSSCAELTVNRRAEPAGKSPATPVQFPLHSFLWGLIPGKKLPLPSALCAGDQLESVHFWMDSGDVWLTVVTLGIYVPHRADISCSK